MACTHDAPAALVDAQSQKKAHLAGQKKWQAKQKQKMHSANADSANAVHNTVDIKTLNTNKRDRRTMEDIQAEVFEKRRRA